MECRCVQCGFLIKTVYVQYSLGNIRLMKCILLIDLILHKTKTYRHLPYNVRKKENFESLTAVQDKSLILESSKGESGTPKSFSSLLSLSICWKILMDVFFGNFMFVLTFLSVVRIFPSTSISITRCKDFLLAILISSYFKIFLIVMMFWEFPSPVIFIIDLFVLSSNIVALKVMTEPATSQYVVGALLQSAYSKAFCHPAPSTQMTVLGHFLYNAGAKAFLIGLES